MQATRALESVALGLLFVTIVCLVFYVGTERSRTRSMAITIMMLAFFEGKVVDNSPVNITFISTSIVRKH